MTKKQTIKAMKNPPAEAISLAQTIFEALAAIDVMRPTLDKLYYDTAVEIGCELPELVDCEEHDVIEAVIEMGEDKIAEYNKLNDAKFPAHGFTAGPGQCPILCMESDIRKLKYEMAKIMFNFLSGLGMLDGVTWERIDGTHHYLKFAEIQLQVLSNHVSTDLRKYLPNRVWTK